MARHFDSRKPICRWQVAVLMGMWAGSASAALLPTYPVGTTPGTWQVDRYTPAVFDNAGTVNGRPNVLNLGVAAADSQANRPGNFLNVFYNTQGRGLVLDLSAYSVIHGNVYVPASWASSAGPATNRRTDMWGQASAATGDSVCANSACNLFPTIGFTNADPASPLTAGGTGRFRVFDTSVGGVELFAVPVLYDQWNSVCLAYSGTDIKTYINGTLAHTQTDLEQDYVDPVTQIPGGPISRFARVIMQAYNFGADYTAQWSGLGAGKLAAVNTSAGGGQSALPGQAFTTPLSVVARDADGLVLPCVPVTFTAPASGASASLTAMTVITDINGVATVSATANDALGAYNVTANAPGLDSAATFALRNGAAVAGAARPVPVNGTAMLVCSAFLLLGAAWWVRRRQAFTRR